MADQPNVLLVLSDEHSFRYFGHRDASGGGEPVRTPTFDGIAGSSTSFDNAYCQVPVCTPSRITMLTGREQQHCDAWWNASGILKPEYETLPERLSQAGYGTCLVGKMHLKGKYQFRGFDHRPYGDITGKTGHQVDPLSNISSDRYMAGTVPQDEQYADPTRAKYAGAGPTEIPESLLQERNVVSESLSFLREHEHANPDQPWFLCASFSRPHFPLTAPKRQFEHYWPDEVTEPVIGREGDAADHPFTERLVENSQVDEMTERELMRARAAYFACVEYLDQTIGDMLAMMDRDGLLDDTIVVYTSDHGELAGEHGLWWKHTWHEGAARVPLLIQLPEHRSRNFAPARVQTPVSLIDLFPTLCGLTGTPVPEVLDGFDLSTAVRTGAKVDRGPVFVDYLYPRIGDGSEFRVIRDGRYKYVRFRDMGPELLFDVASDPLEQTDLVSAKTVEYDDVLERFRTICDETLDFEEAEAARLRHEETWKDEYEPTIARGTAGNAYLLEDGRLIDGDAVLYKPYTLVENARNVFE